MRRYLGPMRAYLTISRRIDPDAAEDLLQEFVTSRVLEQSIAARADRDRGRFRNLLLSSLNRFVVDAARRRSALKRGGGNVTSLDALLESDLLGRSDDPTRRFEQELAKQIIRQTIERVENWCASSGQDVAWQLLRLQVIEPALYGADRSPYGTLVKQLGIESPVQAASLLQTAKRIFKRNLRSVLAEHGFSPDDDADLGELIQMLRSTSARPAQGLRN